MNRRVFISGPIQGVETKQEYRNGIREICLRNGYEPVDPWEREKVLYSGTEHGWWNKVPAEDFIRRDLQDIETCNVLVAFLPTLSAGTCMELFYAKQKGKKTICVCQLKSPSPWIIAHCDSIIKTIAELENALE